MELPKPLTAEQRRAVNAALLRSVKVVEVLPLPLAPTGRETSGEET